MKAWLIHWSGYIALEVSVCTALVTVAFGARIYRWEAIVWIASCGVWAAVSAVQSRTVRVQSQTIRTQRAAIDLLKQRKAWLWS